MPQEEELADAKRPDIRVHGSGFKGPVPIELKIADKNWSGTKLFERLENQLCGDYLRDNHSSCGVYLLLYRGTKKHWEHPVTSERLDFLALISALQSHVDQYIQDLSRIEEVKVIGIDLTVRSNCKT